MHRRFQHFCGSNKTRMGWSRTSARLIAQFEAELAGQADGAT
jgi:hypothetical protein